MFKLGRGGGRGGNVKRPLPPSHGTRPGGASSSRSIMGGASAASASRGRGARGPAPVVAAQATEESFSLVLGKLLSFGAIIRLAPDLVDEIRKAEARGASVKIKFDANSNDPSANVIDVDGKEFRFTWSRDFGDLCDIYEECENGEDGNGLLVERGSAWRKLNVQRVLDESIKNHVKMMSEEAERRKESRKAIVLDPANPSVKNQSSAAVEGNLRRMPWKRKKEPPYKSSRTEPAKVLNLGASTFKPLSSTKQSMRGRNSVSPHRSPLEKPGHGSSMSPYGAENSSKYPATSEGFNPATSNKGDIFNYSESEKIPPEMPRREAFGNKAKDAASAKPVDLRSMLISMLSENPKGMSFKAIEKVVGETMPNSLKKLEAVLKNVATYISPGRYVLKSGVSLESSLRHQSESGSSPESNRQEAQEVTTADPTDKTTREEIEPASNKFSIEDEVFDILEKSDKPETSPDPLTKDSQANNDSEGTSSSSESGSDSDSESESSDSGSDSGSQSRSRSKTRSPADSASASSSDSESDGSSSSKDTDIDVDITSSGDEKVVIKPSPSPKPWQSHDGSYNKGISEAFDDDLAPSHHPPSNMLEGGDDGVQIVANTDIKIDNIIQSFENAEYGNETNGKKFEEMTPLPPEPLKEAERGQSNFEGSLRSGMLASTNLANAEKSQFPKSVPSNDRSGFSDRIPKSNSKRLYEEKPHELMGNFNYPVKSASSSENISHRREADISGQVNHAPRKSEEKLNKELKKPESRSIHSDDYMVHESEKRSASAGSAAYGNLNRKRQSPDFLDVSQLDAQESTRRYSDTNTKRKPFNRDKSGRSADSSDPSTNDDERTSYPRDADVQVSNRLNPKDKVSASMGRNQRDPVNDNSENADRHSKGSEAHNTKTDERGRIPKDDGKSSSLHKGNIENLSTISTKGPSLKRELSDLEVGELREPTSTEDTQVSKRQLDRKGSFKSSKTRTTETGGWHADVVKGKGAADINQELIKQSPILDSRIRNSQEGLSRKVLEESRPQMRPTSQSQQRQKMDQLDLENTQSGRNQDSCQPQQRQKVDQLDSENAQYGRIQDSSWMDESKETYWKKEISRKEATSNGDKKMESPEQDVSFFVKFEKDEPELRGPIKDYDQYKDYVEEYTEKFKCYKALSEQIERIRAEFLKIGGDFPELAKGKDKKAYDDCCQRLAKYHHQHKKRAVRMKKTFIVLHKELEALKRWIKDFAEEYTRD